MPETAPKGCHNTSMNNLPWLARENPQQLFILREIFILWGGVTTPILHSPISENGPSAIQGERATSPFSIP